MKSWNEGTRSNRLNRLEGISPPLLKTLNPIRFNFHFCAHLRPMPVAGAPKCDNTQPTSSHKPGEQTAVTSLKVESEMVPSRNAVESCELSYCYIGYSIGYIHIESQMNIVNHIWTCWIHWRQAIDLPWSVENIEPSSKPSNRSCHGTKWEPVDGVDICRPQPLAMSVVHLETEASMSHTKISMKLPLFRPAVITCVILMYFWRLLSLRSVIPIFLEGWMERTYKTATLLAWAACSGFTPNFIHFLCSCLFRFMILPKRTDCMLIAEESRAHREKLQLQDLLHESKLPVPCSAY